MNRNLLSFVRPASLMMVILFISSGMLRANTFNFPRFGNDSDLKLLGYTKVVNGKLRLSPSIPGAGIGGAWLPEKQPVKNGFITTFQIQITEKHYGADGLAFVIQNGTPVPVLGAGGGNLCYGGISNQLVIHFDNYHWPRGATTALHYDEIAVQAAATPSIPLYNSFSNTLALADQGVVYSDGAVHTVKIVYVPGILRVYLDDLDDPIITTQIRLDKVMNLDAGRAWVGFTAASGAEWQNHDVVSWKFDSVNSVNSPSPTNRPIPSFMPVYLGTVPAAEKLNAETLPEDRRFGYALPGEMHPAGRIMVSTNLMQWETLTNASYYFRDQDSTNYPRRFYRFETSR